MNITRNLVAAVLMTIVTTLLLGVIYPLAITAIAQVAFPDQANGQLIERNGTVVGSRLIGQGFSSPGYFRPRPSAAGTGYDAANSAGSQLGPTNKKLIDAVTANVEAARKENPNAPVPIDLVTTSASGLRSAHLAGRRRIPGAARGARARHRRGGGPAPGRGQHRRTDSSASSARRASTCSSSTSRSMRSIGGQEVVRAGAAPWRDHDPPLTPCWRGSRRSERARLRIYIGAAPGVGKTYEMLQEAHALRATGLDVVVGFVETYDRRDTQAQLKDLEVIPRRKVEYRGTTMEEMDVDAIVQRRPQVCVVDELAHTNVPGSRHAKRYEDVLEMLDAGIHVMTAVNIQHLETLNDAVARATGVRVRETVPDTFLDRADEVINVDVTVEELRNRLREGKIYRPEKVEQALTNFFRKGNLSTLRELALRAVADEVGEKAASYRAREGLEPALIPERVMVCMSSNALAPRVIRTGARIAGRLGSKWYAVYVETPRETARPHRPPDAEALQQNIRLAESLGATVVRVKAERPADGLIAFAQREGVTHVIFGQSARSRWELVWRGSTLDRFLERGSGCSGAGRAAERGVVMSARAVVRHPDRGAGGVRVYDAAVGTAARSAARVGRPARAIHQSGRCVEPGGDGRHG